MFNAYELITESNKTSILPVSGGAKHYAPKVNDNEQEQLLKDTLIQYEEILKEERVCRKLNLSMAEWDDLQKLAVLSKLKGSHFQKFGRTTKEGTFLLPEETLFLIDQGALELKYNGLPLSLSEAYMMILPLLPSIEYYQVYSYLSKLGFVVTRYTNNEESKLVSRWETRPPSPLAGLTVGDKQPDDHLELLTTGYVKNLWCEDEKPCLKPCEASSSSAILSKLQIIKMKKFKDLVNQETSNGRYTIDFNVYNSKAIKKSNLGIPNFRISVCKYSQHPPSLIDLAHLSNASNRVSLKLGLVNQGTVSFYGVFQTDLPTLLSPLG